MKDKVIYEVQCEIPPTYCCDGREAVEKLDAMLAAVDAALEKVRNYEKDNV